MRAIGFLLMTLWLALAPAAWAQGVPSGGSEGPPPHLRIELVPETSVPRAGGRVALALVSTPQPGWHGYWQNPGDAGFPAKFAWTLPAGVTAGEPAYPAPDRLLIAGLMNYVFDKPYTPIVELTVPAGLAAGTRLPVRLHLQYLVCTTSLCVPEQGDFAVDLAVGDGAIDPATRARFDGWRRALPQPLGSPATYQASGGAVRIAVPYPASAAGRDAYFYPLTSGAIDYAAPQAVARDGDRLIVTTKGKPSGPIAGVLSVDGRALALTATPGVVPAVAAVASNGSALSGALLAFLGAVLGGLILNVMPCVFPILSLKALSLAKAGGDERAARGEALAYTAGAIAMCVALGAAVVGLRAGGNAAGWAFQLQDARVVVLLMLLALGIALNLAGLFELAMPGFVSRGQGTAGAFGTGALAAFVATPCAGPFLGVALGAALVLPWYVGLLVFAGLGFGLGLPFLALGFVPALRRRLPRPGPWMANLRRILSIPMFVTAVGLAWLLGQEAGVNGMALGLLVALGAAIVLWAGGRRQARGLGFGVAALVMLAAIAVAGVWLVQRAHRPAAAIANAAGTEPFSETRLAQLRASGRPVFAYFTADWCLSCKVNERVAIDTDAVRAAFKAKNVATLVGDWTTGDPALGRFIAAHGRAGVPLYLYYPAGGGEPCELPQILTPGVLTAL
ncbi:MAG: thioredoxin family protein [Sphingomonas sp.]|uniref:protein-disulfide reductase DsbD family protein n=1 Tax=Sphingomonas sp. TaxID=28214 RepID=UPI001ACA649F|nr:thioredoxin family protein [Sphingomonas sp.]MBN8808235.1 thioredoxin family protein [Sphingomonas sp.]